MKFRYTYLIWAGCLWLGVAGCASSGMNKKVSVTPVRTLTPDSMSTVGVDVNIHIPEKVFTGRTRLIVVPQLLQKDSMLAEYTPMVFDAPIYSKKMNRRVLLDGYVDTLANVARKVNNRKEYDVTYSERVAVPADIDGGRIVAVLSTDGCGECGIADTVDIAYINNIPTLIEPKKSLQLNWIEPEFVIRPKVMEGRGEALLQFVINRYDINLSLGDNRNEMNRMLATLQKIVTDSLATLNRVSIYGMASADGSYAFNTTLSRNRANSAKNWLVDQLHISASQASRFSVGSRPEGWMPVLQAMIADGHSFPSLADALETVWLSGFYIRPDANGNGIPDCAEEPDDQGETDIAYKSITEHVCVDETTYLGNVRIFVDAQDDKVGTKLTFTCYPYNGNGQKIEQEAELRQDDKGYFFELSLPVGDYSISGLSTYNGLRAQVHPLKTTWKRNASDTDWNNWSNWTDGSPWGCTNVVIPAGATRYPDLNAWGSVDKFYGGNYCANIHFEPGAAVLNTQYLEYDCAYVEMEVQSGMYHMISTPLHGMVTGDMFVSPEMPAYFTPLNGATYREVRHNPIVRQKMYSRAVTTATSGTNGTVVATADWSRTFNAVAQPYEQAQGIKMMVGNDWGTSYRLRFPKAYTEYNYYTLSGGWVKKETLPEGARNMNGKFAYEVSGFNPENAGNSFTFELRNDGKGATYFVAGNPFMSYLDIKTFLTKNKQSVQAIRIIDSESVFGEEEGLVRISLGKNGDLSFNVAGEQSNTIAPLQAFYVEALEGYTSDNVNITYTSDMFVQPSASTATRSSRSASVPTAGEMKISAVSGNSVSSCSLLRSAGASDAYNAKEDIVSLIDEDFMPKVKVYTVADKRALDIQKMSNATRVGLGFMVKDGSQQTEFTLDYGSNWKGWTLVDKQTGKRYLLDGTSLTVNAGAMKSNDGRFYLVKE